MDFVYFVIAFISGTVVGGQLNHAIYRFAFNPRLISPWSRREAGASPAQLADRIPVYGWLKLARDSKVHGKNFWIRPLLIEVGLGCAFAWLLKYIVYDREIVASAVSAVPTVTNTYVWYGWYLFLTSAMVVATFIDFDEKTIPDEVTVPVTIIGLILAAVYPAYRLPVVVQPQGVIGVGSLHIGSPSELPPQWIDGEYAIWIALGCFLGWCFAILPFLWTLRYGISGYFRFAIASVLRPERKKPSRIPRQRRHMHPITALILIIALVGSVGIYLVWNFRGVQPAAWESLMCALIGLGFSGGIVWAIRIVGFLALQREAMGFGDVTLMAMIGVYMGWQSALLIFIFAAVFALVAIVLLSLFIRDSEIPYGPYLCLGTLVVMIGWSSIWNGWAGPRVFHVANILLPVLGVALLLMGPLLLIVNLIKNMVLGYTDK